MKLKEQDFKYIKINFEFQDKIVMILAEPYKTFSEIKQKALNKFMEVSNNIHFYYLGIDLCKNEEEKIGTIFNHKEQVTILLRLPKLKLKSNYKGDISSTETKKKLTLLNSQFIPLNNIKNLYNLKVIKNPDSDKKNNIVSSFDSRKKKRFKLINSSSMPNLYSRKSNINQIYNTNRTKSIYNNIEFNLNSFNNNLSFCEAHKYRVSEYCRTCKTFICHECRLTQMHKNHLTIKLNFNNLEESIKLYIMMVITNEKRNLEIINKNALSDGDSIIDKETLNKKKDSVNDECDKIIKNYNSLIKKIENKISKDTKNYKTIVINTFNDIALKISKQINEILNKLDDDMSKRGKKLSVDELHYFFNEISKKEETLDLIGDRTIKYLISWEINKKIEKTFDKIENTLDEIINEENIFNLEHKYNKEIMKINVIQNNKQEYNNIDKKINKGILKRGGQRRNGLIFGDD